jgi:hypothetical protein
MGAIPQGGMILTGESEPYRMILAKNSIPGNYERKLFAGNDLCANLKISSVFHLSTSLKRAFGNYLQLFSLIIPGLCRNAHYNVCGLAQNPAVRNRAGTLKMTPRNTI